MFHYSILALCLQPPPLLKLEDLSDLPHIWIEKTKGLCWQGEGSGTLREALAPPCDISKGPFTLTVRAGGSNAGRTGGGLFSPAILRWAVKCRWVRSGSGSSPRKLLSSEATSLGWKSPPCRSTSAPLLRSSRSACCLTLLPGTRNRPSTCRSDKEF